MFSSSRTNVGTVAMVRVWDPRLTLIHSKGRGFVPASTCVVLTVAPGAVPLSALYHGDPGVSSWLQEVWRSVRTHSRTPVPPSSRAASHICEPPVDQELEVPGSPRDQEASPLQEALPRPTSRQTGLIHAARAWVCFRGTPWGPGTLEVRAAAPYIVMWAQELEFEVCFTSFWYRY